MKKEFFFYATSHKHKRRVTVAGVVLPDGKMKISTAECMPVDNFSKKFGRDLATKRALELPNLVGKAPVITKDLNGELTNKNAARVLIDAVKNDLKLKPWKREWPTEEVKNV